MCFPSTEQLPIVLKYILGGYVLSSVFRGQTLGSRIFTHNHEANKQCQVCKPLTGLSTKTLCLLQLLPAMSLEIIGSVLSQFIMEETTSPCARPRMEGPSPESRPRTCLLIVNKSQYQG